MKLEPELSLEIARFSWENADILCKKQHGCADYHKVWALMRLFLRNDNLPVGQQLWKIMAESTSHLEGKRYLVSGGADTGLLLGVYSALKEKSSRNFEFSILFSDQCATPCRQVDRLSPFLSLKVDTFVSDVLDINEYGFSGISAHNFLLFFEEEKRRKVIQKWYQMLAPGGVAAIFQSVSRGVEEGATSKPISGEALEKRLQEVEDKALRFGISSKFLEDFKDRVFKFWSIPDTIPSPPSLDQFIGEFYDSGFKNVVVHPIEIVRGGKSPIVLSSKFSNLSYGFIAKK